MRHLLTNNSWDEGQKVDINKSKCRLKMFQNSAFSWLSLYLGEREEKTISAALLYTTV